MSNSISSYIPTGNATGTRNRDNLNFTAPAVPQAMTLYAKFQVRGVSTVSQGILTVGAFAASRFSLFITSGGSYGLLLQNATTSAATVTAGAAVVGEIVELRGTITSAGTIQLFVTRNGGAETSSSTTTVALPQTWNTTAMFLGTFTASGNTAMLGMLAACIVRGLQSLDTMRRYAGTHTRNG